MQCEWCSKESVELNVAKNWGVEYRVCDTCKDRDANNLCVVCGEEVLGGTIAGKCLGCKEDEIVKRERERTAILHGVEVNDTGSRQAHIDEDSFERWMVSSDIAPLRLTNEKRKSVRAIWLRMRLVRDYSWTEQEVQENMEDAVDLVETHMVKMASSKYFIHLERNGKEAIPFGYREIGRKGKVSILRQVTG